MSSLFISANKDTLFPLLSQTNDFKNVLCPEQEFIMSTARSDR